MLNAQTILTRSRTAAFGAVVLSTLGGAALYARGAVSAGRESQALAVSPFVMESWLTYYAPGDPGGAVSRKRVLYRRADGATVEEVVRLRSGTRLRRVMLGDGQRIHINDSQGIRTTVPMPQERLDRRSRHQAWARKRAARGQGPRCARQFEFMTGTAVIAGIETRIYERELLGSGGLVRLTNYRAPSLGCQPLKRVHEDRNADGTFSKRWEDVAQYVRPAGASDAEIDSGSSYREVRPTEFVRLTFPGAALRGAESMPTATKRLESLYGEQEGREER